jgi:di- and tripeptidase
VCAFLLYVSSLIGICGYDRHYDVVSAPSEGWESDPFILSGRNGYLYGRGVTDNKGPIMAVACAAAALLGRRALGLDVVFLIEGEEEVDSAGFGDAVEAHKVMMLICQ